MTRIKGDDTIASAAAVPGPMRAPRRHTTLLVASVVFGVGCLVSAGMPLWEKSQRDARARRTVEQLRTFTQAFQTYSKQNGEWPPATSAAGQVPVGMEDLLDPSWSRRTPIGGRYQWAPDVLQRGQRHRATIVIRPIDGSPVADDRALLQAIDRNIDDGDLHTGIFQLGYRDRPFLSLAP